MWIPFTAEPHHLQFAAQMMREMRQHFTPEECGYLEQQVKLVEFADDATGGNAGYFSPSLQKIFINTHPDVNFDGLHPLSSCERAATLAHEMRHPLLLLAAQDSRAGYLIINPDIRRAAQKRAEEYAPEAVKEVEKILESPRSEHRPDWSQFSAEECVAAQLYMIMDNRYYDLFGSSSAARITGRGYTMPNRDHEVGCNLKGLQAVEEAATGQPAFLVQQLAGDIVQLLDEKVSASLKKNPNRAPVQLKHGGRPAG